jgi:hypothetical protein
LAKAGAGPRCQLSERFEQAIDRCAMKIGAKDADAYLAEWRKAAPYEVEGEPDEVAAQVAAQLEAEFDTERLKSLINAEGWAQGLKPKETDMALSFFRKDTKETTAAGRRDRGLPEGLFDRGNAAHRRKGGGFPRPPAQGHARLHRPYRRHAHRGHGGHGQAHRGRRL